MENNQYLTHDKVLNINF